ncbi:hypothetical protein PFISCL1PPCAC_26695, partial [Pristionchus fissidentatus]
QFHPLSLDALNELRMYNYLYQKPDFTKIPLVHEFFRIFHNGIPYVCVAMEILGPTIYKVVRFCDPLEIPFASHVKRNILEGLRYLHEVIGVAHLDISPSNIVFRGNFTVERGCVPLSADIRIIDFNASEQIDRIDGRLRFIQSYRAPEVIL